MNILPSFDFSGKTVLVTGSTQNLGYSIATFFAQSGARVVVHGSTHEKTEAARLAMNAIVPGSEIHAVAFDLGKQDKIDAAFSELEARGLLPDILVNNGAHLGLGESGFLEQSPEFFREVVEVNFFGAFRCSQLAASYMKKRGVGAIINISSLAGERGIWDRSGYNTSKAALDGLTRSMAMELAPIGIRVNSISLGYVWTPRWDHIGSEKAARRRKNTPCQEPTQQEEVARMVLFLASDAAPSLVGSTIIMDGGLGLQQVPRDVSV